MDHLAYKQYFELMHIVLIHQGVDYSNVILIWKCGQLNKLRIFSDIFWINEFDSQLNPAERLAWHITQWNAKSIWSPCITFEIIFWWPNLFITIQRLAVGKNNDNITIFKLMILADLADLNRDKLIYLFIFFLVPKREILVMQHFSNFQIIRDHITIVNWVVSGVVKLKRIYCNPVAVLNNVSLWEKVILGPSGSHDVVIT